MRYGDLLARYDEFYYGSTDFEGAGDLRFELAFDWDGSGDYYQNDAIYLLSWTTERGRDSLIRAGGNGFEMPDVGKASFVLDNANRRFDSYNTASPLYGLIEPGVKMRFRIWDSADNEYYIFVGTIDDIVVEPESQTCVIKCVDPWGFLQKKKVKSPVMENVDPETVIEYILDYIGYPWDTYISGSSISYYEFPYWVCDSAKSAAALIWEVCNSCMKDFYIYPDGTAQFIDHVYICSYGTVDEEPGFEMTSDITEEMLTPYFLYISEPKIKKVIFLPNPWDFRFDTVKADFQSIVESSTDPQVIYQSSVLTFASGETKTIWAKYSNKTSGASGTFLGAVDVVLPVAGTDFIGNSLADGTGTNTTSDFGILFTDYGTEAKVQFFNYGSTANYLTTFQIRGIPILGNAYSLYYPSANAETTENVFVVKAPWAKNPSGSSDVLDIGALSIDHILNFFDMPPLESAIVQIENRPEIQFSNKYFVLIYLESFSSMAYICKVGKIVHESGNSPQQVITKIKLAPLSPVMELGS